jgi:dTDP-4-amino-4,6-dideoxygalactose transaminase
MRRGGDLQGLAARPATLFARGRFALHEGLRVLARARGVRRVWLPAWLCAPVPEAVVAADLGVAWYDIDEQLAPRLDAIRPVRGDSLLVIHYFGLAQPLSLVRRFCDAHGLALIEDCAHALSCRAEAAGVGTVGDVAVFSPRKQAAVAGGGILVVAEDLAGHVRAPAVGGLGDAREMARLGLMLLERVAFAAGVNVLALKDRLPVIDVTDAAARPMTTATDYGHPPAPSRLVAHALGHVDWEALIRRRRQTYAALAGALARVPTVTLAIPQPPPGSTPLALPLWTAGADRLARALRRRGIEATCWPWGEQPPFDHARFPGAARWLTASVWLPLTAPLSPRRLARYVDAVADAAREQHAHTGARAA